VTFLYENIPDNYWVGNDPLALARLLRDLDSPHARMCFDTGHALMTGTIADRMAACSDVIGYLHVHDNDAIVDDHRMPGDGVTDWPEVGRTLRQQGIDVIAMLEVFYLAPQLETLLRTDLPANLADWLNIQSPAHP
jgi:sugar phosphate isomerase/epimerase